MLYVGVGYQLYNMFGNEFQTNMGKILKGSIYDFLIGILNLLGRSLVFSKLHEFCMFVGSFMVMWYIGLKLEKYIDKKYHKFYSIAIPVMFLIFVYLGSGAYLYSYFSNPSGQYYSTLGEYLIKLIIVIIQHIIAYLGFTIFSIITLVSMIVFGKIQPVGITLIIYYMVASGIIKIAFGGVLGLLVANYK